MSFPPQRRCICTWPRGEGFGYMGRQGEMGLGSAPRGGDGRYGFPRMHYSKYWADGKANISYDIRLQEL